MNEIRCKKCGRLLFKHSEAEVDFASAPFQEEMEIEIVCPKCKYLNKINM